MTDLGYYCMMIAFLFSSYAFLGPYMGLSRKGVMLRSVENAITAVFVLLTVASIALLYALVTRDFQVEYVANHTSRELPLFYTISAFWAGQDGSLLLWAWLLSLFSYIVVLQNRYKNRELMPYVISVLSATELFFLILLIFPSNPFSRLPFVPENGQGMNPLLQNPGMIFHPPTLYLGYVGFTIPFAFAISALITGQLGEGWLKSTRGWIIFSWYMLGIGILLGANWAYQVLGWGGYWAWDPVENASLMPWLTGTAFLHSIMIQEKRGMLKVWNMVLIIVTFLLCIFGTFITRSGIISSVHAFARSSIGYYFIVFIIISGAYSFYLVNKRKGGLSSEKHLDSLLSRESSFLFNNLILVGGAFAVFWGTIFPIVSEAVRGVKITVGPPFFNKIMTPIGFLLLFLTGICPLISWSKATWSNFRRNFLIPTISSILFFIILLVAGINHIKAAISFSLCFFVFITILLEYYRGTRARMQLLGEGVIRAFVNLNLKNRRRYGGYLIHIAMLMIFVGITGSSAFSIEKEVVLKKGESIEINSYRITYSDFKIERKINKFIAQAELIVTNNEKQIGIMKPVKAFYLNQMDQPVSEVFIRMGLKEDLYAILAGYEEFGRTAIFKFLVNPLVLWIWIGGAAMTAGTIIAVWPERKR